MKKLRTVVWGTGNVGRPAIRAVLSHGNLELAGVVVANPEKVGLDAGKLAGIDPCSVTATDQPGSLINGDIDAVVYTATADTRPEAALDDLLLCLRAGANVVSTSFYAFLDPSLTPPDMLSAINEACEASGASLFISGIDPGWALDILPVFLSGVVAGIEEIRIQEVFNYALYDQPEVVREVIGFGGDMDELPLMLHDFSLCLVWEPMVRLLAQGLGLEVDKIETEVERRALERSIDVAGMGHFEAGTQGAFRFEVRGVCNGKTLFVVEHITRIDDACAPDWPYPPEGQGCHRVIISGTPNLHVTIHGEDPVEPGPAGGGNASAAVRLVNAVEAVCAAKSGVLTSWDLGTVSGAAQIRTAD